MTVALAGVGSALPVQTVDNDSFEALGVDDAWIVSRTGVRRRRRLASGEKLVDLAVEAARQAVADAGLLCADIDFVVVATSTPDRVSPGLAPEVAHRLGTGGVGAVDVNGACTGFLYGLDYSVSRVSHGSCDRILVIGADAMSRITNPCDRNTAPLFGDAAGAVVVAAAPVCEACSPLLSFGSDGERVNSLYVDRQTQQVVMDGGDVYAKAVDAMTGELETVLAAVGLRPEDLDLLICHQANARILGSVGRRLRFAADRVVCAIEDVGNTSSASIPVALRRAQVEGRLRAGHRLGLSAFGAGFTWGAGVLRWKQCAHTTSEGAR